MDNRPTDEEIQSFLESYIECALWSSTDCDEEGNMGSPLDEDHGIDDIDAECMREMLSDCANFLADNYEDIGGRIGQAAHDFWLTRNGHGAGFWDGDWPNDVGERLTKESKAYGGVDLYVHNGKVRC